MSVIPVSLHGWNWTSSLMVLLNLLVGGVFVALIKSRPALKRIAADREANLLVERAGEMEKMRARIDKLEAQQREEDDAHAQQIRELELQQAAKDRLHEAQRAIDRHRINNLNQAFTSLLMLLKRGVSVEDAVAEVEKMRIEQIKREAEEATTIRAAAITATGPEAKL